MLIHLNTEASYRIRKLLYLLGAKPSCELFVDLLKFDLGQRNLEVFAELHELAEINFTHVLEQLIEFAIDRNVLSRIELEDVIKTPPPELVNVQFGLFVRHPLEATLGSFVESGQFGPQRVEQLLHLLFILGRLELVL